MYSPFFYKKMGFSPPIRCIDCSKFEEVECNHCMEKAKVKVFQLAKITGKGKFPYICTKHKDEKKGVICYNCDTESQVDIPIYYRKFKGGAEKYICKECNKKHEGETVKCDSKNCKF